MKKLLLVILISAAAFTGSAQSFRTDTLVSTILKQNKIGLDPRRKIDVYLPPSYTTTKQKYPVVYYFHTMFTSAEELIKASKLDTLLNEAFSQKQSKEFILVIPDCSGPTTGSLYENSPTTGRWQDYITEELVPYIDQHYRTIPKSESRATTGDIMGGRGALVLAMSRPDLFGVVYALHPVATGLGVLPWVSTDINWDKIEQARSFSDLSSAGGFTAIFVAIQQAFLPDTTKPPFYCQFMFEKVDGKMKLNAANMQKCKEGFLLDHYLVSHREQLSRLRAIAFDWGRFDGIQEHVISAQNFSRQLMDLGIPHEAEEYAGVPWSHNWSDSGRFYTRVLPFLNKYIHFDKQ